MDLEVICSCDEETTDKLKTLYNAQHISSKSEFKAAQVTLQNDRNKMFLLDIDKFPLVELQTILQVLKDTYM